MKNKLQIFIIVSLLMFFNFHVLAQQADNVYAAPVSYGQYKDPPNVYYVDQSFFKPAPGKRILGMYNKRTNTIYILNTLNERERLYTYWHEMGHFFGYGEKGADDLAISITGYRLPGRDYSYGKSYSSV